MGKLITFFVISDHVTVSDPLVKVKLLRHYCCDYYGSVIWNLSHNSIEDICAVSYTHLTLPTKRIV